MNLSDDDFFEKLRLIPEITPQDAIARAGSAGSYRRVLTISVRMLPVSVAKLAEYINTDITRYCVEVHGIKSVLKSIGADYLSDTALELERLSEKNTVPDNKFLVMHKNFIAQVTNCLNNLRMITETDTPPKKTPADINTLKNILPAVKKAAEYYDSDKALSLLDKTSALSFGGAVDGYIDELRESLEFYDYDKALVIINKMNGESV